MIYSTNVKLSMRKMLLSLFIFLALFVGAEGEEKTILGIDKLIIDDFSPLEGKNIALLTNNAGRAGNGRLSADIFMNSDRCQLVSILTPEHGFHASVPAGKKVKDTMLFGVPVYSLYGSNRRPTKEQLESCDAVVVDIQDIGIRSYTYFSTVYKTMDACAEYGKQVFILDRPNPMGGLIVDGNIIDEGWFSFLGVIPVTYIHGCTIGELALMTNEEGWLTKDEEGKPRHCELEIIKMINWERDMQWEDTGLEWTATSPHIPTTDAVRGAAMLGIIGELGTISIGIGSDKPFQYIGRPVFDTAKVRKKLDSLVFPGITLESLTFSPSYGMYKNKTVKGYKLVFNKDNDFMPYSTGIKILLGIRKLYPDVFPRDGLNKVKHSLFCKATGTEELYNALMKRASDDYILRYAQKGLDEYKKLRENYLLYR